MRSDAEPGCNARALPPDTAWASVAPALRALMRAANSSASTHAVALPSAAAPILGLCNHSRVQFGRSQTRRAITWTRSTASEFDDRPLQSSEWTLGADVVFKGVTPRMPHRGVREVVGIVSPTTPRQLLEGIGEGERFSHDGCRCLYPIVVRAVHQPQQHHHHHRALSCFYQTAVSALRADPNHRVLVLADEAEAGGLALAALRATVGVTIQVFPNTSDATVHRRQRAALLTAPYVVWGPSTPDKLLLLLRAQPYQSVWSWCGRHAERGDCGYPLPWSVATTEVQVRPRDASASKGSCAEHLQVRSTHSPSWDALPLSDAMLSRYTSVDAEALVGGEWKVEHGCIAFEASKKRSVVPMLAQAQPEAQHVLWPLPWARVRTEYVGGYISPTSWLGDGNAELGTRASPFERNGSHIRLPVGEQCVWHANRSLFVAEMTMGNLYHSLFHAVTTREHFARLPAEELGEAPELLPYYLIYWPHSVADDGGLGLTSLALRGVTNATTAGVLEMTRRASALTRPGECHCYRRIFGGHGQFNQFDVASMQRRTTAFSRSIAINIGLPEPTPPATGTGRLLFLLRAGFSRTIYNAAELQAAVAADALLQPRVHFVSLEALPVVEQARLALTSSAIAGVHGQGLAWSALLAGGVGARITAEITGSPFVPEWKIFKRDDYQRTSRWCGAAYVRIVEESAPRQSRFNDSCDFRYCGNLTVNVSLINDRLRAMLSFVDHGVLPSRHLFAHIGSGRAG